MPLSLRNQTADQRAGVSEPAADSLAKEHAAHGDVLVLGAVPRSTRAGPAAQDPHLVEARGSKAPQRRMGGQVRR